MTSRPQRRWLGRQIDKLLGRSLDAAGGGRRWRNAPTVTTLAADVLASGTTIRRRAEYAAVNNPYAAAIARVWPANIIGTGITPRPLHPDAAVRQALLALWNIWSEAADADGRTDFAGLQLAGARDMVVAGEGLLRFVPSPGLIPFALQRLHSEQLDTALSRELPGGGRIVGGVEFDATGRRVAYHLYPRRPTEGVAFSITPVRVPADDVIHLYVSLGVGQARGLSWLAPVLLLLKELDELGDATLVKQKIAAMFAAFLTDTAGDGAGFGDAATAAAGVLEGGLEPGTIKTLPTGADIKFAEPPQVGDAKDFAKHMLHAIAAGAGVTYEQISADMTGVNYSSARVALLEFRRHAETIQHSVIVPQLLRPVWRRFVTTAILSGALPVTDFAMRPADYFACEWIPPAWPWVDPEKDVRAEILAMNALLKSRSEVIAERGYDAEAVDAAIAADRKRADALGLAPNTSAASITSNERTEANA